ncbi:hypothetical protein C8R45DRAFT_939666 [Mycena sanguinolenta]|nr:hypothetical protein C8R45DRAFT_939666 [Mycena sanguinolenta]
MYSTTDILTSARRVWLEEKGLPEKEERTRSQKARWKQEGRVRVAVWTSRLFAESGIDSQFSEIFAIGGVFPVQALAPWLRAHPHPQRRVRAPHPGCVGVRGVPHTDTDWNWSRRKGAPVNEYTAFYYPLSPEARSSHPVALARLAYLRVHRFPVQFMLHYTTPHRPLLLDATPPAAHARSSFLSTFRLVLHQQNLGPFSVVRPYAVKKKKTSKIIHPPLPNEYEIGKKDIIAVITATTANTYATDQPHPASSHPPPARTRFQ